jgi:hydrogenase-4 component E
MYKFTYEIIVFILLLDLYFLGIGRLRNAVHVFAFQSILVALFPFSAYHRHFSVLLLFFFFLNVFTKSILFPYLLLRGLRKTQISYEWRPYMSYTQSLLIGFFVLLGTIWFSQKFLATQILPIVPFYFSAAIFTIFVGIFLIVARKKAMTQIVGYLIMENGIFLLGNTIPHEISLLVEIGILLDAFVAVFILSMAIEHIKAQFNDLSVDNLSSLRG